MERYLSARGHTEQWNCESNLTVEEPPRDKPNEPLQQVHLSDDSDVSEEEQEAEVIDSFIGAASKKVHLAEDMAQRRRKEEVNHNLDNPADAKKNQEEVNVNSDDPANAKNNQEEVNVNPDDPADVKEGQEEVYDNPDELPDAKTDQEEVDVNLDDHGDVREDQEGVNNKPKNPADAKTDQEEVSNNLDAQEEHQLYFNHNSDRPGTEATDQQPVGNGTASSVFKCQFCSQTCNIKSNLRRHIKRKHGDEANNMSALDSGNCQCFECGYKCRKISDLRQHLTSHHDVEFREESLNFPSYAGKYLFSEFTCPIDILLSIILSII